MNRRRSRLDRGKNTALNPTQMTSLSLENEQKKSGGVSIKMGSANPGRGDCQKSAYLKKAFATRAQGGIARTCGQSILDENSTKGRGNASRRTKRRDSERSESSTELQANGSETSDVRLGGSGGKVGMAGQSGHQYLLRTGNFEKGQSRVKIVKCNRNTQGT